MTLIEMDEPTSFVKRIKSNYTVNDIETLVHVVCDLNPDNGRTDDLVYQFNDKTKKLLEEIDKTCQTDGEALIALGVLCTNFGTTFFCQAEDIFPQILESVASLIVDAKKAKEDK